MNKLIKPNKFFIILPTVVFFFGCADWNSVPVAVDDNFGKSVRHMIRAQTLNPQPTFATKPVLGLDGQKSEGNIKVYRTGNTDLRQGKIPLELKIDTGDK